MALKYQNYYRILGVKRSASADDIRDAFRRLARKYHPDTHPGDKKAEEKFKAATEAYEVLSNPARRQQYDALGSDWRTGQEFSPPSGWRWPFGSGRRRRGFSEFFHSLFGGGREGQSARITVQPNTREETSNRGIDIEADVTITLEQAFRGCTTAVAVRMSDTAGSNSARPTLRKYEVKIPAGIHDGARIRLAGQGRPAKEKEGQPGDLYLRVHIAPHPVFRLRDNDIEMDLAISPWEAALGTKISVATLEGPVEMTLPAGSQSGQRMRLRGQGMALADGTRGDQHVVLKIAVPETLTPRERELFESLARESPFNPRPQEGQVNEPQRRTGAEESKEPVSR